MEKKGIGIQSVISRVLFLLNGLLCYTPVSHQKSYFYRVLPPKKPTHHRHFLASVQMGKNNIEQHLIVQQLVSRAPIQPECRELDSLRVVCSLNKTSATSAVPDMNCQAFSSHNTYLVGGFNLSEQYQSIGMIIPNKWKNKEWSKAPASIVNTVSVTVNTAAFCFSAMLTDQFQVPILTYIYIYIYIIMYIYIYIYIYIYRYNMVKSPLVFIPFHSS